MYVSSWPGLRAVDLLRRPRGGDAPYPFSSQNGISFYVARSGIYHLFRALHLKAGETVLVPDYHSGNEVAAMRAAGVDIAFYSIRRNLEPDLDELSRLAKRLNPKAIYVIHYLGWPQPIREIQSLCAEHGCRLIEDCALALLSETERKPLGAFGDYSIFCLYKTLPVPNGGLLVQNGKPLEELRHLDLERSPKIATLGRSMELVLETVQSRLNGIGTILFDAKRAAGSLMRHRGVRHVPVGDIGWDAANVRFAMSRMSTAVMRGMDYQAIRARRRENFLSLKRKIQDRVTMLREDLPEGVCPLFFPILVKEKKSAAEALRQRGIGAVDFWNDQLPGANPGPDARYLREHVLELPIHQAVTAGQVQYIADQVRALDLQPCPC